MQSKTSFFNASLFRRNLQRFWPLWLFYAAVWFVLIPLIEAANLLWTNYRQNELAEETFRTARTIIRNATEGGGTVIIFIFAAFFAMALFSYLYQPRAVGMMHAIAVRRESLFVTNCVTGIFFFASSHLFIVICSAIVTLSDGRGAALFRLCDAVCAVYRLHRGAARVLRHFELPCHRRRGAGERLCRQLPFRLLRHQ